MDVDAVLRAADALVGEAQRRSRGEAPDRRFDLPLDVLADLSDELEPDPGSTLAAALTGRVRRSPPPEGSSWCLEHQRFDLCHADAP